MYELKKGDAGSGAATDGAERFCTNTRVAIHAAWKLGLMQARMLMSVAVVRSAAFLVKLLPERSVFG